MQDLIQIQSHLHDKASRSFKKVSSKSQKMLLVAPSHDEVIPTGFRKTINKILKSIMSTECSNIFEQFS